MTDDQLRELGKQLPWDRPDAARRDAVRSALLVEATESVDARPADRPLARRRWLVTGTAFAAGALAAAAIAALVVRPQSAPALDLPHPAEIVASSETRFEHEVVATATGADEVLHVHEGTIRITSEHARPGDRVRLQTRDAEVEGAGVYEATVVGESLNAVSVRSGSAAIRVTGQRTVMLAAGQTWRSSIITTDLTPSAIPQPDKPADLSSDKAMATPDKVADTSSDKAMATPDKVAAVADRRADKAMATPDKVAAVADKRADKALATPDKTAVVDKRADKAMATPDKTAVADKPATGTAGGNRTDAGQDFAASMSGGSIADRTVTPSSPTVSGNATPNGSQARGRSPIELRFQSGWALLKQGKAREAAADLGAAADAAPDDPLAADARYFQAVALVRAGERAQAERVLLAFVDHAPKSLRRGRAAVLLGRLIGERGDRESARTWLQSAVADPDPAIAAAAKAGLQAFERPSRQ